MSVEDKATATSNVTMMKNVVALNFCIRGLSHPFDQSRALSAHCISPLELEMACNQARQWTGDYSLDFNELLPRLCYAPFQSPDNKHTNSEFVDVSLINNRVRTLGMKDVTSLCEATVKDVDLSILT
ncbi:Diphthamide biosynthesis protein 2 [Bulinus truncatus]|nr:Diphthamide biosynthesis protein 2 [Bulinus truncatus]